MKTIVAVILALIFGIHASEPRAESDASTHMAYAVVITKKAEPKPQPKPDGKAPKAKPTDCKCVDCKCANCPEDCLPVEWKWDATKGEYHKMQGATVLETRKYKKVAIQSCNGRRCVITGYQWVPVK